MSDLSSADGVDSAKTPEEKKSPRRTAVIAGVSVLTAAVLGVGAYGAIKFLGSGPQPADALPSSTIGLVSVDLRPSAGQLLEASNAIKKFPALKGKANFDTADELRNTLFERATQDSPCSNISYDKQIKPWLGDSFGFGGVELTKGEIVPVGALEVKDESQAKLGIDALAACGGAKPSDFGYAFNNGFVLITDSSAHATSIAAEAKKKSLKDDADYSKWTKAAGDSGVLNFFVSKNAASAAIDLAKKQAPSGADLSTLSSVPNSFQGLGGTLRFADAGLELSVVTGATSIADGAQVGKAIEALPNDTSIALGSGFGKNTAKNFLEQIKTQFGTEAESMISDLQSQSGLTLPDDLQTLLGKTIVLSLGGTAPADLSKISSPADVPVAVDINGDPAKIGEVVSKLEKAAGATLADLGAEQVSSSDHYVLATSKAYADSVLAKGSLGDTKNFKTAVPNADKATSVLFLNLDSDWINSAVQSISGFSSSATSDKVKANVAPLQAFGVSSWRDGDIAHVLVKLTTD